MERNIKSVMDNKVTETQSAGGVVLNNKGEVLVVSQQQGPSWSLPKGHIEDGEKEMEAAKREIQEESGITHLEYIRDLGRYSRYRIGMGGGEDKTKLKTMIMFLFKTDQTVLKPIDPHNPEARWVAKDKVVELLTHQKDKEFFLKILKEI